MRETPMTSPQARWRCACPEWTSGRECVEIRYNRPSDEECECACHEREDDND